MGRKRGRCEELPRLRRLRLLSNFALRICRLKLRTWADRPLDRGEAGSAGIWRIARVGARDVHRSDALLRAGIFHHPWTAYLPPVPDCEKPDHQRGPQESLPKCAGVHNCPVLASLSVSLLPQLRRPRWTWAAADLLLTRFALLEMALLMPTSFGCWERNPGAELA
jgi:hypothetical protein